MNNIDTTELFRRSLAAHEAGDLSAAAAGYRDVLAAEPGQIDATHYLGMVAYQAGDTQAALQLVGQAVSERPDDPAILANYGLILISANQIDEAARALERSLSISPLQPQALFSQALIHGGAARNNAAIACLYKVLAIVPGHRAARLELARVLYATKNAQGARKVLEDAYELDPSDHELLLELGELRELTGDIDQALEAYQLVSEAEDGMRSQAQVRTSILWRRNGRLASALVAARSAVYANAENHDAHRGLGQCLKEFGRLGQAATAFRRAHALLRRPGSTVGLDRLSFIRTSKAKLRHDIDQFRYLADQGAECDNLQALISDHQALLETMPESLPDGRTIAMPEPVRQRVAGFYNRCHHYVDEPRQDGPVIAPELNADEVARDYHERAPGLTWVDDMLTPKALEGLRRHCLESTIWYDFEHPNGYVGAYLQEGLNCPLIIQIAEELPRALPGIFEDHVLMQLWAYKYGSGPAGINMHADFAAINVNFWITPDEANMDQESGGLVLWDKEAPPEWGVDEYNTDNPTQQKRILEYLESEGAERVVVPHRQNRFLIFNSDLFHKTDRINFADGYANRRINVTMLYGTRDADRRGRRA